MEEVLPKINRKDYFYYDETSPTFLRWAVTILAGRTGRTMNKGKHTYAVGRVQRDGVCYSATFGVHYYGLLPAFKKACEWRSKKVQELNATKNAGFTPLHGLSEVAENRVV